MPGKEGAGPQSGAGGGGLGPLGHIVGPFARAGRFYAQVWSRYLGDQPSDLPVVRPTPTLAVHALMDEVLVAGFRLFRGMPGPEVFERVQGEVTAALEFYEQKGWLADPERFFAAPPPLFEVRSKPAKDGGRSYQRISFDSGYAPDPDEPGAERWASFAGNEREYALLLRHDEPRPWLVCLHGSSMGRAGIDMRIFRAWHLHEDLGLNVVLPVLPMHGPRKRGLPKDAEFPGVNLIDTVHATAQAVWDIRRLLSWIRSQEPDSPIGLNSMSLGGYIASLVASLDDGLTCAMLGVPLVDMVQMFGYHAGFAEDDPRKEFLTVAEPIGRMLSPLSLTPRVPPQGRFVYAGIADQIVHPRANAVRLWEHWGRPEVFWYHGGHTSFFRSEPVQEFIEDALVQSGLVERSAVES